MFIVPRSLKYAIRAAFKLSPKFVTSVATLARRRRGKSHAHHRRETKIARVAAPLRGRIEGALTFAGTCFSRYK